ncbi:MAG: thioredoxin family protein [Elusimicrobiota bacterium]
MKDIKCNDGMCKVTEKQKKLADEFKKTPDDISGPAALVYFFGKKECPLCKQVKSLLEDMREADISMNLEYFDLDTVNGLSKAAFYNAFELPVLIVFQNGQEIKRWDGIVPDADSFRELFDNQ